MSKKIFISPERRPAPHGKYWGMDGVYEHNVCCEVAEILRPLLEHNSFEVFIAPPEWAKEERCAYANENRFDYYLCIHSNGAGNGKKEGTATGCECLYYNAPASIRANLLVYDELTKLYPSKRGVKDYSRFAENNLTNMVSCYPELAFHDNGKDAAWIVSHKQEIAVALCKGVCEYFGIGYEDKPADTQSIAELQAWVQELEKMLIAESEQRGALQRKHDQLLVAINKVIDEYA